MNLSSGQTRLLSRLARTQRITAVVGGLLAVVGVSYATWGFLRFDVEVDPREAPGFDRPISDLAFVFETHQQAFERVRAITPNEELLKGSLLSSMSLGASLTLVLVRLFVGVIVAVLGMVMMTVVVERARLLRIIERMQEVDARAQPS